MLGFLPTRAYRPGTPGATTFLSPLSGTFNYGWDSFLRRRVERQAVQSETLQRQIERLDGRMTRLAEYYKKLAETLRGRWR